MLFVCILDISTIEKAIITVVIVAVLLLGSKSFAQNANRSISISDVLSFSLTQPASLNVNFNTAANTSWNGSKSMNKFNISYLIDAGGAYVGKTAGLNGVPMVYTVTQQ